MLGFLLCKGQQYRLYLLVRNLVGQIEIELERCFFFLHGQDKGCVEILRDVSTAFLDFVQTHRSQAIVWLEWGAAVREDVWPRYRAFTEAIVDITRRTLDRCQQEGCVASDADTESLARLFASSSQSIARLQLGGVDPQTVARFQQTVLRAIVSEEALA